jgi:hypothetical protein
MLLRKLTQFLQDIEMCSRIRVNGVELIGEANILAHCNTVSGRAGMALHLE